MTNSPRPAADATTLHEQIRAKFQAAQRVVIVSHVRPDGDAVGSVLGLGLALENAGKRVHMALADGTPRSFTFLKGSERIQRGVPEAELTAADLVVTVDCSDLQRTGGLLAWRAPDINIDHHVTNLGFAALNLVVPEQVATAAIIAEALPAWGLALDLPIAEALLTGLVTDTLGFRTSNMNPEALRLSADLMEYGADLPNLYMRSLVSKSYEAARYWGAGLNSLQRETLKGKNGVLIWTTLSLEDREEARYPGNDDADLVNVLSSIESDVAVIFVEQKNGHVKVSWRARSGYDVSKIALKFNGGGHPAASGADIRGSLAAVRALVLEATREMIVQTYDQNNGKNTVPSAT
jgi:bifunctional oligoribonuclease and PAP phosphatase NrnA